MKAPRVLLVTNQDWFFLSHRLALARAIRDEGGEVVVVAGETGKGEVVRRAGFPFVALPILRAGIAPRRELGTVTFLARLYRRVRPDLVHHVTLKPVLYGSLAARFAGDVAVVNTLSGLGYAFTSSEARARLARLCVQLLCRVTLTRPRSRTIFQNPEDREDFVRLGLVAGAQAVVIRGSGVDCSLFRPGPELPGDPIVMLASRMLWDKGVREFVDAAVAIRRRGRNARFVLVGAPDYGNPSAVPAAQLEAWSLDGAVEWWGHRDDMPAVLSQASVVVLPTVYGEGVPKVLIEAAASARPIVATDARGCREIARPGVNGLLVAAGDAADLARAIETLLASPELRRRFGAAGREIAVAEFTEEAVVAQTLAVYRELLGARCFTAGRCERA